MKYKRKIFNNNYLAQVNGNLGFKHYLTKKYS
jgi:hypothetical protein